MAGNILSPTAVWQDFKICGERNINLIAEYSSGDVTVSRLYLTGKKVDGEFVKIYVAVAKKTNRKKLPAVFVAQDYKDGADESLIVDLAKMGYVACTFDFVGSTEENKNSTVYPKSMSKVNYINCKDSLTSVPTDVTNTCWYEWGVTARYVYDYFSTREYVSKIAFLGIGFGATLLWQLAVTNKPDCAAFFMNAGWASYRGVHKYSKQSDPELTEEQLKFVAGIEPQSYAINVKCPTLIEVASNSDRYDLDRAYDTFTRISGKVYKAIDYSIGFRNSVCNEAYNNTLTFFNKFLLKTNGILPTETDVSAKIENGEALIKVVPCLENLKSVCVYCAEETVEPSLRYWNKITDCVQNEDGSFTFSYLPYKKSGLISVFAKCFYENGFSVCSNVIFLEFEEKDINTSFKSNVIYSSRQKGSDSVFSPAKENVVRPTGVNLAESKKVLFGTGPMDIQGVSCFGGVMTFAVNTEKFRPKEDAMLMLDVYVKEDSVLTVKLITDYFGEKVEYFATEDLTKGEIWHNVKLEISQFKTKEGRPLKTYENVQALEIDAMGYHLINNVLWV